MSDRRVWKATLITAIAWAGTPVKLPAGAKFLHCAEQHGQIALWFDVDPDAEPVNRLFQVVGTGHGPIDAGLTYVGTALLEGGSLVLHVFEGTP